MRRLIVAASAATIAILTLLANETYVFRDAQFSLYVSLETEFVIR